MGMTLTNTSGDYAMNRLKNMLVADRIGCDRAVFSDIRQDIYHTVSKYFDTSADDIKIWIQHSNISEDDMTENRSGTILCAGIPVNKYIRTKD